jgi:hypothetical protein
MSFPRLTDVEHGALEIYIFDPAHDEEPFPGAIVGKVLRLDDPEACANLLTEAANSADNDDAIMRNALTRLASEARRCAP